MCPMRLFLYVLGTFLLICQKEDTLCPRESEKSRNFRKQMKNWMGASRSGARNAIRKRKKKNRAGRTVPWLNRRFWHVRFRWNILFWRREVPFEWTRPKYLHFLHENLKITLKNYAKSAWGSWTCSRNSAVNIPVCKSRSQAHRRISSSKLSILWPLLLPIWQSCLFDYRQSVVRNENIEHEKNVMIMFQ